MAHEGTDEDMPIDRSAMDPESSIFLLSNFHGASPKITALSQPMADEPGSLANHVTPRTDNAVSGPRVRLRSPRGKAGSGWTNRWYAGGLLINILPSPCASRGRSRFPLSVTLTRPWWRVSTDARQMCAHGRPHQASGGLSTPPSRCWGTCAIGQWQWHCARAICSQPRLRGCKRPRQHSGQAFFFSFLFLFSLSSLLSLGSLPPLLSSETSPMLLLSSILASLVRSPRAGAGC